MDVEWAYWHGDSVSRYCLFSALEIILVCRTEFVNVIQKFPLYGYIMQMQINLC